MVKFIIPIILIISSCVSLKNQEKNELCDIVELTLNLPEKGRINDTLDIEVILINKGTKKVFFYEPGYISMMKNTDAFIMVMPIDLFVKKSKSPRKILTLESLDSLKFYYKLPIDYISFGIGKIPFEITFTTVRPKRKGKDPLVYSGYLVSNIDTIEIVPR